MSGKGIFGDDFLLILVLFILLVIVLED
ncbi:YjcZ family sporulation protein [Brevibacillus migulae]|nr:YjcZ family sporulation protein [Brevibacillus migulae]